MLLFFLSGFSFTDADNSPGSRGREGRTIFHSTLPLPPAHEPWDIYLQLCMWDDYHVFLIATFVYQTATWWDLPPYWVTLWLIDWWCNVCLIDDLILDFLLQRLQETGEFELASTITLKLQANRLTKCDSHSFF